MDLSLAARRTVDACAGLTPAVADNRPNVLVFFADDWGRYASPYARLEPGGPSELISTPSVERMAREGMLFTNAFVNAPSCTPCRSSLLSGQYFWRTGLGAILQGARWDDSIPSYPLLLEQAGYHIGHTYKVWSPGAPSDQPHGGARTAFNSAGRKFNNFSQHVEQGRDRQAARRELLDEIRGNLAAFLQSVPDDTPFCYWCGPTNTHRKWVQGSGLRHWGLDPEQLVGKLPKFLPDEPLIREDFCDYLGEVQAVDLGLGVLLEELDRRGLADNTLVIVSGDHGIPGIPRGKCDMYDLGTRVPLLVRWPGVVRPGLVIDDFVSLPDLAPTILQAAGLQPPEVMTARSLLPVLAADQSGRIDPSRDAVIIGRERHVAAARHDYLPYPQRAIRTAEYLYIINFKPDRWPMGTAPGFGLPLEADWPEFAALRDNTLVAFADLDASPTKGWLLTHRDQPRVVAAVELTLGLRPAEELYRVFDDPDQLHNLAEVAELQSVKAQLRQRLLATLQSTGDPRVVAEEAAFDRSPFADPVEGRQRPADAQPRRSRTAEQP